MTGSAESAGSPLRPGDPAQIGGYRLATLLGEGGMGRVYLARSPAGQPVAVKVIRTDVANGDQFRRRFRDEVARARQVPPFCTAEVLDADPDHEPPYLVVEYVDGPDLASVVRERGPLSPANLHALAVGVATALTAIHGAGVIHRDLKAANVLLAPGSPKVIDFGLAREVDATVQHTSTGELVGTVAYMAPERLEPAGRELTPAADVFSWGAVVAFAATGRVPFPADTLPAMAYQIMTAEPDLRGLPADLRGLVQEALAKDPRARPSARNLLDRLLAGPADAGRRSTPPVDRADLLRTGTERAQVEQPDPAGPTVADGTVAMPARSRRWGPRLAAAAAVAMALVLGAGLVAEYGAPWLGAGAGASSTTPPDSTPSTPPPGSAAVIPAGAQQVLRDPLTAARHWEDHTHEETGTTCTFAGGLVATTGSASYRCPGPRDHLATLAVFVDVTPTAPGSCPTIWFRFTVADGGYALRVCEDAYYFTTHGTPEPHTVRNLRVFRLGEPLAGTTRVGITAEGEEFRFYRDGWLVGTWSDGIFTAGQVWLGVLQMDPEVRPPYQVTFTNVEIWGRGS
jgi:eukaryotic-like serine/threonine-protein kinase